MRACFILILLVSSLLIPTSSRAAVPPITNSLVTRPDALRVRVTEAGLQQIDAQALQAPGWDLATLDPSRIHLWHRSHEEELDIRCVSDGRLDPGDTLQFIGRLNAIRFSRESVYWLSVADTPGLRGTPQLAPGDPVRWEEDRRYQTRWSSVNGDRWYGRERVTAPERDRTSVHVSLPVRAPAGTHLHLAVVGMTPQAHTLTLAINGRALDPLTWSGTAPYVGSVRLPFTVLPGALQLDVTIMSDRPDTVLIDWVALPDVRPAYSATPYTPIVERGPAVDPSTGPPLTQTGATYLLITHHTLRPALDPLIAAHEQRAERVGVMDVQVAYDAWSFGERDPEAIRSLIRTAVVQWQPAPRAVLLVGYGNARMRVEPGETEPTVIPPYFVAADPVRGEIACDTCYTRLDAADPLDDPLPDLPAGRLPARTLADAQTIVRKTAQMLTAPPPSRWRTEMLLLADNDYNLQRQPDPAGSFVATVETAAALLPRGMHAQRFYYVPDRPSGNGFSGDVAELRCRLFRALDGGSRADRTCPPLPAGTEPGAAMWIYAGHGSPWQWAETSPMAPTPYLWYLYDADARTNGDRLPILLSLTCLSGDFANPTLMTTDERLLLHPGGGVVASLSATGQGVNMGHAQLLHGLLPQLFGRTGDRTLGAAHLAGLRAVVASGAHLDLTYSFGILGDPLVTVPFVPTHTVRSGARRTTMMQRYAGVAVLTSSVECQRWLRQALDAAGIAHWMVLLQDRQRGRMLPPFDGPLLLDTVGFERPILAALLAELHDRRPPLPTLVRVAPDDHATQRLSLLCSAVYAVAWAAIPLADLRLWFRYVGLVGSERLPSVQPACLGMMLAPLPIHDGNLLRILAELPHASTIQQAAAACAMSERTLKRKLMTARVALGIPATGLTRHRPSELTVLLWTALATKTLASPARSPEDVAIAPIDVPDRGYGEPSLMLA